MGVFKKNIYSPQRDIRWTVTSKKYRRKRSRKERKRENMSNKERIRVVNKWVREYDNMMISLKSVTKYIEMKGL